MRSLLIGLLLALSALAPGAPRPNLVFILADDLGYGDLGCYGQRHFETPHLDRMAAEGLRFTQHYAGCTVCAPSRACLLTGQHTGHVYNRVNGPHQFREDPLDVTVAARLREAGYHTAMIGKSGLSCNSDDGALPSRKGFDHFFGFTSHRRAHRYFPERLWRNGQRVEFPGNQGKKGDTYTGDLFLAEALEYLAARADEERPFFLHLPLQQPHADLAVPAAWRARFVGRYDEEPFAGGHYRAEAHPKATYAAMVAYLDDTVGKVLAALRDHGLAENTLVIFSSDNGAMSEGGWDQRFFDSSGPLRGGKRDLYEGGVRVPTIAWWPGVVAAGRETDHVSAFWDFMPTACELAGVAPPAGIDGLSYAPTLLGSGEQPRHEHLYWEFHERGGKQAVRRGDWKGVRLDVTKAPPGRFELYHLGEDPGEQHNVADEHPDIVTELRRLMDASHGPSPVASF